MQDVVRTRSPWSRQDSQGAPRRWASGGSSAATPGRTGRLGECADAAGLQALVPLDDLELDALPLVQRLVSVALDLEKCTNTSSPPSCWMKPYPFSLLNHLTVPSANSRPLLDSPACATGRRNDKARSGRLQRSPRRPEFRRPARRAAIRVLRRSIAIVIGPTPPGTGVIAPAIGSTESKSTSPTRPASVRLMPTSMTDGAGLDHVGGDHAADGRPRRQHVGAAGHRGQVARARVADRDRGAAVQQRAARPACRRCRSGRPRPRRRPRAAISSRSSSSITPAGVQASEPGLVEHEPADVQGMEAVDVLGRVDALEAPA